MKIQFLKFKVLLFSLLCIVTFSCSDDESPSGNMDNNSSIQNSFLGVDTQKSFLGKVKDDNGSAVANAQVTIGTETIMAYSRGVFILEDVNVKTKQAYIKVEKAGFYKALKTTVPTSGVNNVAITLIRKMPNQVIASGSTSNVTVPSGAKVTFDGNFEDANGNS